MEKRPRQRLLKSAIIIVYAFSCLCVSGCAGIYANSREIEQLQVVQTLGVDVTDKGLVLSIASGKKLDDSPPLIMSAEGPSIAAAMELLQEYAAANDLFFAHTKYILLGEEAARSGVELVLDYVARAPQMRQDAVLFVAREGSAKTLVTGGGDGKYDITEVLASLEEDVKLRGKSLITNCGDVSQALNENGAALCCAVSVADASKVFTSGGGGLTALPVGLAVLKDGKLCSFLDEAASRGVVMLMGESSVGNIVLNVMGSVVTLAPIKSAAKLTPSWQDGALPSGQVSVSMTAGLVELDTPLEITDPAVSQALDEALSLAAMGWVRQALTAQRELGVDFLDVGGRLRRDDPLRFAAIEESWPQSVELMEFSLESRCHVQYSYDLTNPMDLAGGGKGNVTGK